MTHSLRGGRGIKGADEHVKPQDMVSLSMGDPHSTVQHDLQTYVVVIHWRVSLAFSPVSIRSATHSPPSMHKIGVIILPIPAHCVCHWNAQEPGACSTDKKSQNIGIFNPFFEGIYYEGRISTSFSARPFSQISEALPNTSETTYFSPSTTPSGWQSG